MATELRPAWFCLLAVLVWLIAPSVATSGEVAGILPEKPDIPLGVIRPDLLKTAYAGTEKFRYEVAYTGGMKLGELHLEIKPLAKKGAYELHALVTTEGGTFNAIYPIHDIHVTWVYGPERLPYRYEVWQKEGRSYEAHRLTRYHQKSGKIDYRKNDEAPVVYAVTDKVHNEFSSFFSSRLMPFAVGQSFIVRTFADKKLNEVEVRVKERVHLAETILGPVDAFEITPIMKFKGLYDKQGDTRIWYTDDECRVPVKINAKIVIGSLTSTLISYENPACPRYTKAVQAQ